MNSIMGHLLCLVRKNRCSGKVVRPVSDPFSGPARLQQGILHRLRRICPVLENLEYYEQVSGLIIVPA